MNTAERKTDADELFKTLTLPRAGIDDCRTTTSNKHDAGAPHSVRCHAHRRGAKHGVDNPWPGA